MAGTRADTQSAGLASSRVMQCGTDVLVPFPIPGPWPLILPQVEGERLGLTPLATLLVA